MRLQNFLLKSQTHKPDKAQNILIQVTCNHALDSVLSKKNHISLQIIYHYESEWHVYYFLTLSADEG